MNIRARFALCGYKILSLKYPKICFYMQLRKKEKFGGGKKLGKNRKNWKVRREKEYWSFSWYSYGKTSPFSSLKLDQAQGLTELKRMFLFEVLSQ